MFTDIINYFDIFHKSRQLHMTFLTSRQNLDIVKSSKLFKYFINSIICSQKYWVFGLCPSSGFF
jgi:hypothetical protein